MVRTILFFVVMYFLVKLVSRMFLRSAAGKGGSNGASFFYQTFKNMAEQQNQQQKSPEKENGSIKFEEIEEAEYEDVTEEAKSSKTSD